MIPWMHTVRGAALLAGTLLAVAACDTADAEPAPARKLYVVEGFDFPESVRYDPEQDAYLVSNIQGFGSVKDGRGYISRVSAAEPHRVETLVRGGSGGAVLHAPKGMALHGDTLWVTDIDALRGFHRRTGAPLATLDLRPHGVVLVNDVAVGPDGALYVTDTGIEMTPIGVIFREGGKILRIGPGRSVALVPRLSSLEHPNGITWDATRRRWIVVSFDPFRSEAHALRSDAGGEAVLARGLGRYDGVEVLPDGRILVTAWSDSSLHVIQDGRDRKLIRDLWQPADLGVDTRRQRVAIPLVLQGRVEIWQLPAP